MALTRDFKETGKEWAERDPAFAKAMPDEAATAFLNGEAHVARLILRDVVNASVGFEELATETNRPSKSLHRVLSEKGRFRACASNPLMTDPESGPAALPRFWKIPAVRLATPNRAFLLNALRLRHCLSCH